VVRKKRHEKWIANSWFFIYENAPAHRSVLVTDFLAKNNVTTLHHPPHIPDLAPPDFYMFLGLKLALKGRRFWETTEIIENATEELKRISQYGFHEYFQHLYSRWQKYIVAQSEYFQENVADMIVCCLVFLANKVIPGIF
jgi:hypothetical protein